MTERRYGDDEISAIFAKATEGKQALQASNETGMTLAELQEIGREVGISADAVASAARSLDARPPAAPTRLLGLPVGVQRTVVLDRRLSDDEWERLVVQLRETFGARGTVSGHGSFRQWTNGNLQALLEPTASGHRLRLTTTKGSARAGIVAGTMALGFGVISAVASAISGDIAVAIPGIVSLLLAGGGVMAATLIPLPSWARLRGAQMDTITESLAESAATSDNN